MSTDTQPTFAPGAEAVIVYGTGRYPNYTVVRVARVSPTGQVTLEDGRRFTSSGKPMRDFVGITWLRPLTDDIRLEVRRQTAIKAIEKAFRHGYKWERGWSIEVLEGIVAIIEAQATQPDA